MTIRERAVLYPSVMTVVMLPFGEYMRFAMKHWTGFSWLYFSVVDPTIFLAYFGLGVLLRRFASVNLARWLKLTIWTIGLITVIVVGLLLQAWLEVNYLPKGASSSSLPIIFGFLFGRLFADDWANGNSAATP